MGGELTLTLPCVHAGELTLPLPQQASSRKRDGGIMRFKRIIPPSPFFVPFFVIGMHARPRVVLRDSGHPRSYGIPFDVPIDSQQVVVRGHQARLESALPQSARAAMSV